MALKDEKLLSLKELSFHKEVGIRRTRQSWWIYCTKGVVAGNGYRMILESVKIGNRHHTSLEAVKRFLGSLEQCGG